MKDELMSTSDFVDPVLKVGLVISIAVGALLLLFGLDTMDSFIVGLLGIAISFLIDLKAEEKETDARLDSMTSKILKDNDRIFTAIKLDRNLINGEDLIKNMHEVLELWSKIQKECTLGTGKTLADFITNQYAQPQLAKIQKYFQEAVNGEIRWDTGDITPVYNFFLAGDNLKEIKSLSRLNPSYWSKDSGKYFYRLFNDAREQNIPIAHLFIWDKNKIPNGDMQIMFKAIKNQLKHEIKLVDKDNNLVEQNNFEELQIITDKSERRTVLECYRINETSPISVKISNRPEELAMADRLFEAYSRRAQ